jgi:fumarate reductase subunit C
MSEIRPDKSKLYYPKMPATWWLKRPSYFLFMLREFSSVFIAIFLVTFLIQVYQLTRGPEAYAAFAQQLASPGWIIFHIIALFFALYHSITWFYSSAIVLPVRIGETELPRSWVVVLNLALLTAVSLVVLLLFISLRG